jgi:hypothetical protein
MRALTRPAIGSARTTRPPVWSVAQSAPPAERTKPAERPTWSFSGPAALEAPLEKRGHAERIANPDDRRSYLVQLTDDGRRLLRRARPRFRAFAEAVETRLGDERIAGLRGDLAQLREAIEAQLNSG